MSAIAAVLAGMGHHTTGSDIKSTRPLERLGARGVEVEIGHRPENVAGADALTYSTAVAENNVELRQARSLGIPVLSRAEMLEAIVALRRTIAIAGTHGKTTTSSMLALVLVEAGLHPSFIIGGELNEIGTNAAWDSGELLVVEADESDGTFLHLTPGARDRDERGAGPHRALRVLRGAEGGFRGLPRPGPARRSCAPTTRWRRRWRRPRR